MVTQPCYFLALPKELRLQIYEYLMRPDYIQLHSYDQPSAAGIAMEELAQSRIYCGNLHGLESPQRYTQIVRTCRPVNDEAEATLYTPDRLVLDPAVRRFCAGGEHNAALPPQWFNAGKLRSIRSLRSLEVHVCTSSSSRNEDLALSLCFAESLSNVKKTGGFVLHLVDLWHPSCDVGGMQTIVENLEDLIKIWMPFAKATGSRVKVLWGEGGDPTWRKNAKGEWNECPESDMGEDYRASGRVERLFAAVNDGSTGLLT
ncbi:hypothetical protein LTS12_024486 [Elasticomyces elasticus]|nr:hypothetical protein LTS12_024486 [Elasticomyces elasticus]